MQNLVERPAFILPFQVWSSLRHLRIGITGHKGTLGSILSRRLESHGIGVKGYEGDVTDSSSLSDWIDDLRPHVVFHLAAVVPVQQVLSDPLAAMRVNAVANLYLVNALLKHVDRTWLFCASTSHVYEPQAGQRRGIDESAKCEPISLYGATKFAGECVLRPVATHFQIPTCIGRIFSYFHETQHSSFLVPGLIRRIHESCDGDVVDVAECDSVRDLLYAEHVVDIILHLCAAKYVGTINVASGQGYTVGSMADTIAAQMGKKIALRHIPAERPTSLVADVSALRTVLLNQGPLS